MQVNRKRPSPTSHPSKLRSISLDQRSANYGPWTKINWLFLHPHPLSAPLQHPPWLLPRTGIRLHVQDGDLPLATVRLSGVDFHSESWWRGELVQNTHPSPSPHSWAPPPLYQLYQLVAPSSGEGLQLMVTGHKASPPPWMAHLGKLMCVCVCGEWRGELKFSLVI